MPLISTVLRLNAGRAGPSIPMAATRVVVENIDVRKMDLRCMVVWNQSGHVFRVNQEAICSAVFLPMPGTDSSSLTLALRMRLTDPNRRSSASFRLGDMPGQSSSKLSRIRRLRRSSL